jgi:TRAP transporter TAXI family solute receptor
MARIKRKFSVLIVVLSLIFFCVASSEAAATPDFSDIRGDVRVASAALGTIYDFLLNGFAAIISENLPNVRISVMITNGSEENVHLLYNREVEIAAMHQLVALDAIRGEGVFDYQSEMYHLFTCQFVTNFFVTRRGSGITSMEDFRGRRIAIGPPGSANALSARDYLTLGYGMWDQDMSIFYLSMADGADALRDGTVDALHAFTSSFAPPAFLTELDRTLDDLVYIPYSEAAIARIQEVMPLIDGQLIGPSTTPMLRQATVDILAPTTYGNIVARTDMPKDLIYAMMWTLFDNVEKLVDYHAAGAFLSPETALAGARGYKVHPGAAKFFKEAGVWRDYLEIGEVR